MSATTSASDALKKHGLRVTPARKAVFEVFASTSTALSHADIECAMGEMDRVTLYRTLASLEENGIIHPVWDDDSVKKYALCQASCDAHEHRDEHVHFKCKVCNEVRCLSEVNPPHLAVPAGFVTERVEVLLVGTCPGCAA